MRAVRFSNVAQADLVDVLAWSQERFGDGARARYAALVVAAVRDIGTDPERVGSMLRPELGADARTWHLRMSRTRSKDGPVRRPRHFLVYRVEDDGVVVGRVLHDAMELAAHVDAETSWV